MEVNSLNIPLYLAPHLALSGRNAKGTRKEVRVGELALSGKRLAIKVKTGHVGHLKFQITLSIFSRITSFNIKFST